MAVAAQEFLPVSFPVANAHFGNHAWADFDNDGDLDLVLSGDAASTSPLLRFCRNDGAGVFAVFSAGFPDLVAATLAVGDYNRDGRLDLALVGAAFDRQEAWVCRNDGNWQFTRLDGILSRNAVAVWGDSDGDGDLDLAQAMGAMVTNPPSLLINDGNGDFQRAVLRPPHGFNAASSWVDFDGDGDLDLPSGLLTGVGFERNDGDLVFMPLTFSVPGSAGAAFGTAWADFDGDGDLDAAADTQGGFPLFYRNNGNGQFSELPYTAPGANTYSSAWADADNDGDFDLLTVASSGAQLWLNDGEGAFSLAAINVPAAFSGVVRWADYDGDGDLDFFLQPGCGPGGCLPSQLYRNTVAKSNSPPAAPANLSAVVQLDGSVSLRWSAPFDAETTHSNLLTYDLRVGTAPGAINVSAPPADPITGRRRVAAPGSLRTTFRRLRGLAKGNYRWSVQAVDPGLAGSLWAEEGAFSITNAAPLIEPIPDQHTRAGGPLTVNFTVSDAETPSGALTVVGASSNQSLLPNSGLLFGGTGATRTLTMQLSASFAGETAVTVTVTDAHGRLAQRTFRVVSDGFAGFAESDLGFDPSSIVSGAALGDMDDDGDLDLLLTGGLVRGGTNQNVLLGRNTGQGVFAWEPWQAAGDTLTPSDWANASPAWVDWNRDGRLDLAVVAEGRLHLFERSANGFVALPAYKRPGGFGGILWRDFDRDGLVDALTTTGAGIELLRQEAGSRLLPLPPAVSPGLYYNGWIDADTDGFPDVLGGTVFHRQNGNTFTVMAGALESIFTKGTGDLDADGDEEVIGFLGSAQGDQIIVARNMGGGAFFRTVAGVSSFGDVVAADFNHDGFNDLFVSRYGNAPAPRLHLNDGQAAFPGTNATLSGQAYGGVLPGDLDGDGDLDLLATGLFLHSGPRLLLNQHAVVNSRPSPPMQLSATPQTNDQVLLAWSRAVDDHTPAAALTYEVRVGTQPGGADVVAPRSHPATGYRRVVRTGEAGGRTNLLLRHLPAGAYYWSVQTVDSSLAGSAWAVESNFVVAKPALSPIAEVHTPGGMPSRAIPFTVTSAHGNPALITVTASADNPELVPPGAIQVLGAGANRALVITPANRTGFAFVTVNAIDATGFSDRVEFRLHVESFTCEPFETLSGDGSTFGGPSVWPDLDGDGILDLVIGGVGSGGHAAILVLRNLGDGRLHLMTNSAPDLSWDTLLADDFNHDNVPDVMFSGFAMGNSQAVWANLRFGQMGLGRPDFALAPQEVGLTRLWGFQTGGGASWLDLNNDGAADFVWWGNTATNTFGYAHRTLAHSLAAGSQFLDPPRVLLGFTPGSVAWADFDRDGDMDLAAPTLHRNDGIGPLVAVESGLSSLAGHLSAADFDQDGWMDLLVLAAVPRLFRNLGNSSFAEVTNNLPAWSWGTGLWGDLDNDGRSDLLLTQSGYVAAFRNVGNGAFAEMPAAFPTLDAANATLADADNDGDLDLVAGAQYFCRNNAVRSNAPPSAPVMLNVSRATTGFALRWSAASDAETPATALTYNVRVGTTPGGSEIVSALADPLTGRRRIAGPGNAGAALFLPLNHLPRGPLYWSVQAIDAAFAGGPFSVEQVYQPSPPTLSTISNLVLAPNVESAPIRFTVWDNDTAPDQFQFAVISGNDSLIAGSNAVVRLDGTDATLRLTPHLHQSGTAEIVLLVTGQDGQWAGVRFTVTVPEEFSLLPVVLPPLNRGSAAWGDADQDGDLDLLTSGFAGLPFFQGSGRVDLWRNDAGTMTTNQSVAFGEGGAGAAMFVDVNRDGNPDISVTGGIAATRLFWQTGPGAFAAAPASWFAGVTRSAMAWGDRDGDGDPELILTGSLSVQLTADSRSWLYNNQNGASFPASPNLTPGLRDGTAEWIDVDNDGDNDLFLTGSTAWHPGAAQTLLFINRNGTLLNATPTGLPNVSDSGAAFADFDLDGDPDLALNGRGLDATVLYRNDGKGQFTVAQTNLPAYAYGSVTWGDYDGDGYPDLLISGVGPQDHRTELWFNDRGVLRPSGNHFADGSGRGVAWGDADGDGDLDLAIIGSPDDGYSPPRIPYFSGVFRNEVRTAPEAPPVPTALGVAVTGSDVVLSWSLPAGARPGASFNVRVGTTPGSGDVMNATADPMTGRLRVPRCGNAGWSGRWLLRSLAQSTYYWSVQSVDAAFRASAFALESTFSIPTRNATPPQILTFSRSGSNQFNLTARGDALQYGLIEQSTDLRSWEHVTSVRFDAQGQLTWTSAISVPKVFFRLRYTP
jgi:hypothetical protein